MKFPIKSFCLSIALPLLVLAASLTAHADTVSITGGSITLSRGGNGSFSMQTPGMDLKGGLSDGALGPDLCAPCGPGTLLQISANYAGASLRSGTGNIGGVQFSQIFYDGGMHIDGLAIPLPSDPPASFTITAPFTFTAFVTGCSQKPVSGCSVANTLFSTQFAGQGLATIELAVLNTTSGVLYSFRSVTYNFASPAAVPEPTTIALLATGLAGLVARSRRRSRGTREG